MLICIFGLELAFLTISLVSSLFLPDFWSLSLFVQFFPFANKSKQTNSWFYGYGLWYHLFGIVRSFVYLFECCVLFLLSFFVVISCFFYFCFFFFEPTLHRFCACHSHNIFLHIFFFRWNLMQKIKTIPSLIAQFFFYRHRFYGWSLSIDVTISSSHATYIATYI